MPPRLVGIPPGDLEEKENVIEETELSKDTIDNSKFVVLEKAESMDAGPRHKYQIILTKRSPT